MKSDRHPTQKPHPWIETHTGQRIDLIAPKASTIRLPDIAHALSSICRFTGHTRAFFSVAEHSLLAEAVARTYRATIRLRLLCLMHDDAEAYVGDVARPLRTLLPRHKSIERRVHIAISSAFSIPPSTPREDAFVKTIDNLLVVSEGFVLLPTGCRDWGIDATPHQSIIDAIRNLPPLDAEAAFTARFYELTAFSSDLLTPTPDSWFTKNGVMASIMKGILP